MCGLWALATGLLIASAAVAARGSGFLFSSDSSFPGDSLALLEWAQEGVCDAHAACTVGVWPGGLLPVGVQLSHCPEVGQPRTRLWDETTRSFLPSLSGKKLSIAAEKACF